MSDVVQRRLSGKAEPYRTSDGTAAQNWIWTPEHRKAKGPLNLKLETLDLKLSSCH